MMSGGEGEEVEAGRPAVGRLELGRVYQPGGGAAEEGGAVQLRGARRRNPGNRISQMIENLHSDKRPDSDDEEEELEEEEEEEVCLGRERMSAIRGMFSNQAKAQNLTADRRTTEKSFSVTSFSEFEELKDEGLVSTNKERFATGHILGSQKAGARKASLETSYIDKKHIESVAARFESGKNVNEATRAEAMKGAAMPRKLRSSEEIFNNGREEVADSVKVEMRIGKIDKDNIFNSINTEESQTAVVKVGKLKVTGDMFNKTEPISEVKRQVKVGKIDAESIFQSEESSEKETKFTVGKLSIDAFKPQSDDIKEMVNNKDLKVGKISTKGLFNKIEENNEDETTKLKVGKLSKDAFIPQNCEGKVKSPEVKVGKINTKDLFKKIEDNTEDEATQLKVGKLTKDVFNPQSDEAKEVSRTELKVGKINTKDLFQIDKNEEEISERETKLKVGKLSKDAFNVQSEESKEIKTEVKVGKISTKELFKKTEDNIEEETTKLKVGKLSKDAFNLEETKEVVKTELKVGKISTKDLFKKAEEASEELLSVVRVGKLTEDKLTLSSNTEPEQESRREVAEVPAGKVSEQATAFQSRPERDARPEPSARSVVRRSESTLEAEMRSKYQQQTAGSSLSLKRSQTSATHHIKEEYTDCVRSSTVLVARGPDGSAVVARAEPAQVREESEPRSAARETFFSSMMTANSSSSGILAVAGEPDLTVAELRAVPRTTNSKRGKELFRRAAEAQEERQEEARPQQLVIPDLEEIEDEFERLHREMMGDSD